MNVRLHIERLVLDGFAMTPAERTHFVDAAQAELGRLARGGAGRRHFVGAGGGEGGRLPSPQGGSREGGAGFATPGVNRGLIQTAGGPFDPVAFGNEVARAGYRGIAGQRGSGGPS